MTHPTTEAQMSALCALARDAGRAILEVYRSDFAVTRKDDRSPVTEADTRAEAIILKGLADDAIGQGCPVVSEEAFADGHAPDIGDGPFWLVDPLDGTRDFIDRNDEFTVNIALVEKSGPVLGVVYAPALDALYWASPLGAFAATGGGEMRAIACRAQPQGGLVALTSRHHNHPDAIAYLDRLDVARRRGTGSSLKFCLVAAGEADIYPRFGRTMEWDTGAGHAVLAQAGGHIAKPDGSPFLYGKPGFENGAFIAHGAFAMPEYPL